MADYSNFNWGNLGNWANWANPAATPTATSIPAATTAPAGGLSSVTPSTSGGDLPLAPAIQTGTGTGPASGLASLTPVTTGTVTAPTLNTAQTVSPVDINTQIAQDYQTLFNRAPDTEGAKYWASSGLTGQALIDAMKAGARGSDIAAEYGTTATGSGISSDITAQGIKDFVNQNPNDPYAIYSAAQKYNVDPQTIIAAMGWQGDTASQAMKNWQTAQTTEQEYKDVTGRELTGGVNPIDKEGFNYWYGQLQSGAIKPEDFHSTVSQAAYDWIQAHPDTDTTEKDKILSSYYKLHPEIATAYSTKAGTDILGADYAGDANYNTFKSDLDKKLQTGQITTSDYTNQLQNSTYNKQQEANRMANILTSVYGQDQATAVQNAKDLYAGKSTDSTLTKYYNQLLTNPNDAITGILTEKANAADAATNPYFQKNPDLLSVYKDIGNTVQFQNAGAGGQYGYYQGIPIIKKSEIDNVFNKLGSDYIQGNAPDKLDNAMGWDTGSLSALEARGAGALGIRKQSSTDENGNATNTYTGDMNAIAKQLNIDPTKYQDTYKTVDQPVYDSDGNQISTQKAQVLDQSGQDKLYNAINDAAKDFYYVAGKTGVGAGGIGEVKNGVKQTAAVTNPAVSGFNHAGVLYKAQGDKLVPIPQTLKGYNAGMELSPGSWLSNTLGDFALPLAIGSMFVAPGLAGALGGGLGGAAGAGAILGGGMAGVTGGDVLKGAALGGLGGGLSTQVGNVGSSFSNIGVTDPAIQNILARGAINLGTGLASGQPLSNLATNTALNTGLNLGLNQAGVPNNALTNAAINAGTQYALTGNINPLSLANSAIRYGMSAAKPTPTKVKEGGLIAMKKGGKVKSGLPHFDDGGGVDLSSFDTGANSWDTPAPTVDISNIGSFSLPDFSSTLGSLNFSSPLFTSQGLPEVQGIATNTGTISPITTTQELTGSSPISSIGQFNDRTAAGTVTAEEAIASGNPQLAGSIVTPQAAIELGIDPNTLIPVASDNLSPQEAADLAKFGLSSSGAAAVADWNIMDPSTASLVNAANTAVNKVTGGLPGITTKIPTVTPGGTSGGSGGTAAQQAGTKSGSAVNEPGLTNLTGSVTKPVVGFTLSGAPIYQPTINPVTKADGGKINLPQVQSINNFIDHDFNSNYAPQMAAGGQTHSGGLDHVPEFYSEGGLKHRFVQGAGDGTSDSVPAMLANGEFVIPADVVSGLGNGSNDSGAKILDEFLKVIRRDKRAAGPDKLPADSKGPQAYLLQAKRKVRK